MTRRAVALLIASAILVPPGCGGTPESRFYLLDEAEAPAQGFSEAVHPDRLVFVDRVHVARYVDRPQLVTREDAHRVTFEEFDVWAEPLADLVTRALVETLGRNLGRGDVLVTPDRALATPTARVVVEILRFDGDAAGNMTLDARWTLLAAADERLAQSGRERIVEPAGDAASNAARIAALARAVAELANRLTNAVRRSMAALPAEIEGPEPGRRPIRR
jgi:uncharacterized lipoprotein YmbA